jgi:hypothetical protein
MKNTRMNTTQVPLLLFNRSKEQIIESEIQEEKFSYDYQQQKPIYMGGKPKKKVGTKCLKSKLTTKNKPYKQTTTDQKNEIDDTK